MSGDTLRSREGGHVYPLRNGIPIFTEREEYWCNVDRATMTEVIARAERSGDWLGAATSLIPDCLSHIEPFYRADAQFLLPIDQSSRILDAGSMWGGITIPLAQYCGRVFALDKTWETLRFLNVRAHQLGIGNITPVVAPIHRMPFPDGYFDCVILNGVLEWLGTEQDIVLNRHWSARRADFRSHTRSPEDMQIEALQELRRVIRPGGTIYIAVENRVGLQYFAGHPDDHVNIRFASLLPRSAANWLTKLRRNTEYRTYTYSPRGLRNLISRAGFGVQETYSAFPHYNAISRLTPFSVFDQLGSTPIEGDAPYNIAARTKVFLLSACWKRVPKPLRKQLSPSLAVIASNATDRAPPARLLSILHHVKALSEEEAAQSSCVIMNSRFGNGHPVNYGVYDNATQRLRYFCKISRRRHDHALEREAAWINRAQKRIAKSEIAGTIPSIVYAGSPSGIPMQVTELIDGRPVGGRVADVLRRARERGRFASIAAKIKPHARRRWLRSVAPDITEAVAWLANFQNLTTEGSFEVGRDGPSWVHEQVSRAADNRLNIRAIDVSVGILCERLTAFQGLTVPLCMQHGDFDVCNLLRTESGIAVLDFEHAASHALPFFDLGNLLLSPFVAEWRSARRKLPVSEYARVTGWQGALRGWIRHFADRSGLPPDVLALLPALAALEQNGKRYPESRDPYDYPMFGDEPLQQLTSWTLVV